MREIGPLQGGIIAAGDGRRLRQAGFPMPKPLVPVAGIPLIGWVIGNFVATRVASLTIIVNERARPCVDWVRGRFPDLDVRFIVKATGSSLESFGEVATHAPPGRLLVSTVDAWCSAADFVRFVAAARQRPAPSTVLAVTPLVEDDDPLWTRRDDAGRIIGLGGAAGDAVTAGVYLLSERVRAMTPPPGLARLRNFLVWLHDQGEPLYGEVIDSVVDVDRAADVALAESLAMPTSPSDPS